MLNRTICEEKFDDGGKLQSSCGLNRCHSAGAGSIDIYAELDEELDRLEGKLFANRRIRFSHPGPSASESESSKKRRRNFYLRRRQGVVRLPVESTLMHKHRIGTMLEEQPHDPRRTEARS